jgi:hypothetical protein
MNDDYTMGFEEFFFDVVIPVMPMAGLAAIPIGLIDMQYAWSRTQGKVRVGMAALSHFLYIFIALALA